MPGKRECQRGNYKGFPTIMVPVGDQDDFISFGYKKAKAIVDNFDEIERFCIDCEHKMEERRNGR